MENEISTHTLAAAMSRIIISRPPTALPREKGGAEVKGMGRGHIQRIKGSVRKRKA